jgi:hypothetical protein
LKLSLFNVRKVNIFTLKNNIMRYFATIIFIFVLHILVWGQNQLWSPTAENAVRNVSGQRYIQPTKAQYFTFDFEVLKSLISKTKRNSIDNFAVPTPDGKMIIFKLQNTPVFDEELQRKYPDYHSFTGYCAEDATALLKLSVSPFGINVMVTSQGLGNFFIDPITMYDHGQQYQVYYKNDFRKKTGRFTCGVTTTDTKSALDTKREDNFASERLAGDCQLRSYRLAIACTGEYARFHGGTKEKVLAAYNNTMTRVNGVYEKDASITMKLIADTDKIIFLDPASDPYSNGNGEAMLGQNQTTVDNIIGRANYDIGHVFSTGGGGIAQLRAPCSNSKAQGVTGQTNPVGDPFDIDYVAHEMGHQFGANHTQNNECQRSGNTAMEPGSASTIMGYAGICDPNIQNNSDPYFHAISIQEMTNFVVAGNGNTCAQSIDIPNNKPEVTVLQNVYTIPISTAFALTASATDKDADPLTYCWEQMNNQVATMPPVASATVGPTFRSLNPSSSSTRHFPDLLRRYSAWEVLPSVTRVLNFRCTVRDNHPLNGCTEEVNVTVNTNASAGPFVVTNPNTTSVSWLVGTKQTVTWNVAKTDLAPINCSFVDIYLSFDGGATYPVEVIKRVPNTGSAQIEVPQYPTSRARIMVVASDNIFYDVSNVNFRIISSFEMDLNPKTINYCNENILSTEIILSPVSNISDPILLSISNPKMGISYDFSDNPISNLPASVGLSLSQISNLAYGQNNTIIQATSGSEKLTVTLDIFRGIIKNEDIVIKTPQNNANGVLSDNVKFSWELIPGIKEYVLEVSQTPTFTNLLFAVTTSGNEIVRNLEEGKVYFWRLKGITPCIQLPFGDTKSFRTAGQTNGQAFLMVNEAILVEKAKSVSITPDKLFVEGNNAEFISYTITELPKHGNIIKDNITLQLGNSFTQSDIISGKVTYQHSGDESKSDGLFINILDDQNRWLPNVKVSLIIKQNTLGAIATRLNLLKCFGDQNGEIKISAFGGIEPYTYAIDGNNFITDSIFKNLDAGIYNIKAKDANGEIITANEISLTEPTKLNLEISQNNYDVLLAGTGGTGMLSYSIDGIVYDTIKKWSDPGNGTYAFYVKDINGCSINESITINIPILKVKGVLVKDVLCAGQALTVNAETEGGIFPYKYSIDNVTFISNSEFNTIKGNPVIFVQDAGGKIVASDTIFTNNPLPIDAIITNNKLEVTVSASGGTGPLEYSSNNIQFGKNNVFNFSDNGAYKLYVRDSLNCSKTLTIILNVIKNVNINKTDVSCTGRNDGSVKLSNQGGTAPIRYSFNHGPFSNVKEWTGLEAGQYKYTVRDSKNDSITGVIDILEPDSLVLDFEIKKDSLTLIVTGGTPPYTHSIDNGLVFLDTNMFTDLEKKSYNVVVKDKNGCIVSRIAELSSLIDTENILALQLRPNPVQNMLEIISQFGIEDGSNVSIYNIDGKVIHLPFEITDNLISVNVSSLVPGIYTVGVYSKNKVYHEKFIKE